MGRTVVSKHLAILKNACLAISRKVGEKTRYHLNAEMLREIRDRVNIAKNFAIKKYLLDKLIRGGAINADSFIGFSVF
jgi:DNA-binding transcriptional ArsR family regulator